MDAIVTSIACLIYKINSTDISSFESDSSSDDEMDFILIKNKCLVDKPRIKNYIDVIYQYSDYDFKSHFRLSKHSFESLILQIAPYMNLKNRGRPATDIKKQLLICLWFLGNQETYRSIGDRFDVPKQTVWNCTFKICNILLTLAPNFISWPKGQEAIKVMEGFQKIAKFPGVIGAIDGIHIEIKAAIVNAGSYINRKGFHSIILQAVADHRCIFVDCYAGHVGSVHDAHVFRCSDLSDRLKSDESMLPRDSHLIGDAAYGLQNILLTPYRDTGHLNSSQHHYNYCHSKTRCVIERSFGLLKGRFRRLKYLDLWRTDLIPILIISCCVLHNICQLEEDIPEFSFENDIDDNDFFENINDTDTSTKNTLGESKRNYICSLLSKNNV